jgi:hypothetical protein
MGISNTIPPSRLIQPGVVANTAARPASPFEGQAIYQTDTDEVLYYNGTSWSRPWNMPWGLVAYTKTSTSNGSYNTTEAVSITSSTFTAVANRYYKVTYVEGTVYSSSTTGTIGRVRLDTLTGTTVAMSYTTTNASASNHMIAEGLFTTTAGSRVVVGTMQIDSGTGTLYRVNIGASIYVEDIGPA